ncbi:ClpP/crotonase [Ascodesmis nigricans]|uniref:ClpP/crotonase n=1 Tax=Ascodesmis nigricans TaxID=341454 RepID=A0A4S2N0G3_9PEZI|nr:ClpP/crotonase [Ascodesmis nigricans]
MANPTCPITHPDLLVTYPTPQILLVTINRPKQMNSVSTSMHAALDQIWTWYDSISSLRCGIITGAAPPSRPGKQPRRAFCAGADLKEWQNRNSSKKANQDSTGGFCGLSNRRGKKPVIAAVHGIAFGGGMETTINCDVVVAHKESVFSLPEAKRGVIAVAGGLPRLALTVGLQRATELALTGRILDAETAREWGLVNEVVEGDVVEAAIRWAGLVAGLSPDAVIATREGLRGTGWYGKMSEDSTKDVEVGVWQKLQEGENIKEGLKAFVEKRDVRWVDSKL